MNASPQPITRRRRTRDLTRAVTLRPDDIFQLYGIPPSTLHDYCNDPDPARRLTSVKIPSRGGTKGVRLVKHTDLRAWLERWSTAAA